MNNALSTQAGLAGNAKQRTVSLPLDAPTSQRPNHIGVQYFRSSVNRPAVYSCFVSSTWVGAWLGKLEVKSG